MPYFENERLSGNEGSGCVSILSALAYNSNLTPREKHSSTTSLSMCVQVCRSHLSFQLTLIQSCSQGEAETVVSLSTARNLNHMALLPAVTAGEVATSTFFPMNISRRSHPFLGKYGAMPVDRARERGSTGAPVRR